MLFYLLTQSLSSIVAFIYPTYASYKSLSRRPANEKDLEHWLMYWAVMGCIMVVEYTAEWAIQWFPFYYLFKFCFLLWLALPQTQGSTILYNQFLQPFLTKSEPQIDSYVSDLKASAYRFIRQAVISLWEKIVAVVSQYTGVNLNAVDPTAAPGNVNPNVAAGGNTSSSQRAGSAGEIALGLWRAWGPTVIGALAQVRELGQQEQQQAAQHQPQQPAAASSSHAQNTAAVEARRRQLEAELAALNRQAPPPPPPSSHSSSSLNITGGLQQSVYLSDSSDHDHENGDGRRGLRNRGRFEEIQRDEVDENEGHPEPTASGGWFSGWGRRASGYERVKSD